MFPKWGLSDLNSSKRVVAESTTVYVSLTQVGKSPVTKVDYSPPQLFLIFLKREFSAKASSRSLVSSPLTRSWISLSISG